MKKLFVLSICCVLIICSAKFVNAAMVSGETAVLTPIHDATVSETNPDLNENGLFLKVFAGQGTQNLNQWSYALFDLSSIPDNAVITTAWLKWYIYGNGYDSMSSNRYIDFWHVDDDTWDESSLTWNNKPSYEYFLARKTPGGTATYTIQIITAGSGVTDWVQPDLADNMFAMAMTTPQDDYYKEFSAYSGDADCGDGHGCLWLELIYDYDDSIASATTDPATDISSKSATLNGNVNPNGEATTCSFDFGIDTSYGDTITGTDPGSGSSDMPVTAEVSGLSPNSTYHYRVVATNSAGTAFGSDQTFTTATLNINPGMLLLLFQ